MTNVTPIGPLLNLPQVSVDSARALMLRVGEEMTATILDMVGNQALIDTNKGARLLATVQSDEPLQTGQTVLLQVVDSTADQLTLRLASATSNPGQPLDPARLLGSIGLSDTEGNRRALEALVAEGQPINKQTVQALRTALAQLQLDQPDDFRAVAYLMARGLPVTPALVNIVRQGLSGASPLALMDDLRKEAASLLEQLPPTTEDESPEVSQLRTALQNLVTSGQGDLRDPTALRQAIADLASSVEAVLGQMAHEGEPGENELAPDPEASNADVFFSDAENLPGSAVPGEPSPPSPTLAQALNQDVVLSEAKDSVATKASSTPSPTMTDSASPDIPGSPSRVSPAVAESSQAPAGSLDVILSEASDLPESVAPEAGSRSPVLPGTAPAPETSFAEARGEAANLLRAAGPAAGTPTSPDPHLAARQLLAALDRAVASGSLPDSVRDGAAAIRDRAQQFVSGVQFQQIQNGLPASSGGPEYLSFPLPLWAGQQSSQGELRLYVHDQTGSRRIDPEDVRIVMKLYMTRLQHLTVSVHVLGRNIMCHIDSENPTVDQLVRASAAELRTQLQQLGYNVAPISCSNLQDGFPASQPVAARKLASVNVKA